MKFSYGDNYYIRREDYVTGYKANNRLSIYTIIAVLYAIIEWQVRVRNADCEGVLYTGIAITGALSVLLLVLFSRKLIRAKVFDIGILMVAIYSIYLLVNNLTILFA